MENPSAFTTATMAKDTIPTTLSACSLDVGQLISANVVQNSSLLSESVTYASALSGFSEALPVFPVRTLRDIATVSLGEHLKMFPGTTTAPASQIMLASPTSPRLRSMCKECLSITKWAVCIFPVTFMEVLNVFRFADRNIPWAGMRRDMSLGKTR
jgi:hypothetical protein